MKNKEEDQVKEQEGENAEIKKEKKVQMYKEEKQER
jgi:hypothetical protein